MTTGKNEFEAVLFHTFGVRVSGEMRIEVRCF